MNEIKVSIIVPIYNTSDYLRQCIDSIENQTLQDIEVILIDDGSTDNSCAIASEYCQKNKSFSLVKKENEGLSIARNTGLERAQGEYVYFLDSDDYLAIDAIERLYKKAKEEELDILKFSAYIFEDGKTDYIWRSENGYKYSGEYEQIFSGEEAFRLFIKYGDYIPSSCLIFTNRRFLLENHFRFYDGILNEDNLFHFEIMSAAKRVTVLNEPLYYRRIRPGSIMTGSQWGKKTQSLCIMIEKIDRFVEQTGSMVDIGSWLISNLFEEIMHHWEKMSTKERFSSETKRSLSRIKPIIKKYSKSKRVRFFLFNRTLYKVVNDIL